VRTSCCVLGGRATGVLGGCSAHERIISRRGQRAGRSTVSSPSDEDTGPPPFRVRTDAIDQ
jgi:hypothetical protein